MKNKFFGYIPYDEKTNKELWDKATFVFDSNIFLNLYRYSNETKNQVIDCLEKISDRVWIPYQTGKEFFAGRVKIILAQESVYLELEKSLKMDTEINAIRKIRHTTLDAQKEKMIDILKKCSEQLNEIIREDRANYQSLIYDDPNLEKILKIFEGKVGEEPSEAQYLEYKKIIDKRYKDKIPPGYKDADKSDDKKYGDAINWLEVIKFSKENNKNIIYVTDEKKEDWIEIKQGKKIGPRKELIDEFYKKTDGCIVGIYNTENFLKYSHKYLVINEYEERNELDKAISEIENVNNYPKYLTMFSGLGGFNALEKLINLNEEEIDKYYETLLKEEENLKLIKNTFDNLKDYY